MRLAVLSRASRPDHRQWRIDPGIVALDAIGLLFYIIPGLIAFGVDFATGAIYLPDNKRAEVDPGELNKAVNPDAASIARALKAIIQQATGHSLPLDDPRLLQRSGSNEQLATWGSPRAPDEATAPHRAAAASRHRRLGGGGDDADPGQGRGLVSAARSACSPA